MRVCRKYYSDLTLCTQVRSECMAKVLQFKAMVWPKVAPDQARKLKNSNIFWGSIPQTLLVASAFPYCKQLKAARGLGTRLLANVVCPCCALASAVLWLRHCGHGPQEFLQVFWHFLRHGETITSKVTDQRKCGKATSQH